MLYAPAFFYLLFVRPDRVQLIENYQFLLAQSAGQRHDLKYSVFCCFCCCCLLFFLDVGEGSLIFVVWAVAGYKM